MLALALPVLSLRLGFVDAGNDPAGTQSRQAYDLLAEGFGPGFNGPFLLAIEMPRRHRPHRRTWPSCSRPSRPTPTSPRPRRPSCNEAGTTAVMRIYPKTSPQDEATTRPAAPTPQTTSSPPPPPGTGSRSYVGGFTAVTDDFAALLGQRLPLFIGIVILLSFLLLMAVFRSILVPLKAAIMNLLSIGAAYGVVVMIFQYGWGKQLVGVGKEGPIQAFLPHHDVRHPLRAVDGLRGVPAVAHP